MLKKFLSLFVAAVMLSFVTVAQAQDYRLEKVLVLSRHNIRAPLAGKDSKIYQVTPHNWFQWTAAPRELSLRGGLLETEMGQYFRKWFVSEGFMPENYLPAEGEVRFYANSRQRTIATAQYFSSGMLPVANVRIEHKSDDYSKTDPVFKTRLNFFSEGYAAAAQKQLAESDSMKLIKAGLRDELSLLEKVLDMKDSAYAKKNGVDKLNADCEIVMEYNKQPDGKGDDWKAAYAASDALILQYYEEADARKAAFGHKITDKQWRQLASIKDIYDDLFFLTPLFATNMANPMLKEMRNELNIDGRKFTFLCGHDSNIETVLTALNVEKYLLPNSIEQKAPIGSKVVIEKRLGNDGKEYAALKLVYFSTAQLRHLETLTTNNPPMIYPLQLKGLRTNDDDLYLFSDVMERFNQAIDAYDEMKAL